MPGEQTNEWKEGEGGSDWGWWGGGIRDWDIYEKF